VPALAASAGTYLGIGIGTARARPSILAAREAEAQHAQVIATQMRMLTRRDRRIEHLERQVVRELGQKALDCEDSNDDREFMCYDCDHCLCVPVEALNQLKGYRPEWLRRVQELSQTESSKK